MMIVRIIVAVLLTAMFSAVGIVMLPFPWGHSAFHWIAQTWARMILNLFGVRCKLYGTEHLEPGKHYIYVSNHASMFDIPAVLGLIPDDINIVLKKELTRVPIWGWALALGPYIVIDRGNPREATRSLEEAAQKIRNGKSVLLFAEGTRTRDGKLQSFKRGAFTLAVKSGVSVVPVTINNTFRILQKGTLRINPMDIEMTLAKPIATDQMSTRQDETKLMEEVHRSISSHYIDQSKD